VVYFLTHCIILIVKSSNDDYIAYLMVHLTFVGEVLLKDDFGI